MVKQYRKKPVVIEAIEWTGDNGGEVDLFCCGKAALTSPTMQFVIQTLEGAMRANIGDYIIKGVKGEFYPCKPDIFAATYEEA